MRLKRVQIHDNYRKNMFDKFGAEARPKGKVEFFEKGKDGTLTKIDSESNLIVYPGRTWLMQRSFKQDLTPSSGASERWLNWFGVGTGGATGGDPLNPVAPDLSDTDLDTNAIINATDPLCAKDGYLHPFDSVLYEQDPSNSNEYLIAKVTTTLGSNDANGATGTTYYDLSEASLWITDTDVPASVTPTSLSLFARVTYSTIRKHSDREIVFIWSIYF